MTLLLDWAIRSSIWIAVALLARWLCRRRSASFRHFLLSSVLVGIAVLAVVPEFVPPLRLAPRVIPDTVRERIEIPAGVVRRMVSEAVPLNGSGRVPIGWLAFGIWITGLCLSLTVLITGAIRIRRLASFSEPINDGPWFLTFRAICGDPLFRRRVRILRTRNSAVLVTYGALSPVLLIPRGSEDWPVTRIEAALRHESAHVLRNDWLIQTVAEILRSLQWFNPMVWFLCAALRRDCEAACDDHVLRAGLSPTEYAKHLFEIVTAMQRSDRAWSSAVGMAGHRSSLERRFQEMLNPHLNREPLTRNTATLMAMMILACAGALGAVTPERLPALAPLFTAVPLGELPRPARFLAVMAPVSPRPAVDPVPVSPGPTGLEVPTQQRSNVFLIPDAVAAGAKDMRIRIENPQANTATSGMVRFDLFGGRGGPEHREDQLATLRIQEKELTARYSPQHPELLMIRSKIRNLENQIATGRSGINSTEGSDAPARAVSVTMGPIAPGTSQNILLSALMNSAGQRWNFAGYLFIRPAFDGAILSAEVLNEGRSESTTPVLEVSRVAQAAPSLQRGDAVRVKSENTNAQVRIVALPGDRVRIDDTAVFVNEVPVSWITAEMLPALPKPWTPEVIPNDHCFVVGMEKRTSANTVSVSRYWALTGLANIEKLPQ